MRTGIIENIIEKHCISSTRQLAHNGEPLHQQILHNSPSCRRLPRQFGSSRNSAVITNELCGRVAIFHLLSAARLDSLLRIHNLKHNVRAVDTNSPFHGSRPTRANSSKTHALTEDCSERMIFFVAFSILLEQQPSLISMVVKLMGICADTPIKSLTMTSSVSKSCAVPCGPQPKTSILRSWARFLLEPGVGRWTAQCPSRRRYATWDTIYITCAHALTARAHLARTCPAIQHSSSYKVGCTWTTRSRCPAYSARRAFFASFLSSGPKTLESQ